MVLRSWAIVKCVDESMEGELSLEDENLIDFFELENEESEIKDTVAR